MPGSAGVLTTEIVDSIAVLTMNRPEARNALNGEMLGALRATMASVAHDDRVSVVVLTGADPAFCAGLDLKQLGSGRGSAPSAGPAVDPARAGGGPWAPLPKPLIAAVNGAAVTGGLEIVLHCDFVVASERARFADTHARVGLLPGWGLSVLLPQAIGVRRAREISLTGNFVDAATAHRWGLVNHVVAHDELLPTARRLAADIAGNDQRAVRALLEEYRDVTATTVTEGLRIEAERAAAWNSDQAALDDVGQRRAAIMERGRRQAGTPGGEQ